MALQFGIYPVKWLCPQHQDKELRPLVECRFWPDIRTVRSDKSVGVPQPVCPVKVSATRDPSLQWMSDDVCMARDLLVGPFDLCTVRSSMRGPKRRAVSENDRIDDVYWKQLEAKAQAFDIEVSNIRLSPEVVHPGQG